MVRVLTDAPRWLLLVALVEAPWLYGSTRDWTITVLNWVLGAMIALWIVSLIARRGLPRINPILLAVVALLVAEGWLLVWNAHYFYDRAMFRFIAIPSPWPGGPGAIDRVDALPVMLTITLLLLTACFVCDLARRPIWRMRIWWTVAATAGSLMLFGLVREAFHIELQSIYPGDIGSPFALYLYHANAAAYINLAMPIVAAFALLAFRARGRQWERAVWPTVLLLCIGGATMAASKAGMIISAALLVAIGAYEAGRRWSRGDIAGMRLLVISLAALVVLGVAGWTGWHIAQVQLARVPDILNGGREWQLRTLAWQAASTMLPDAGVWGIGPGNFAIAFPHYTNAYGNKLAGIWDYLHEDYLQTAIEWGWIGASLWSLFLVGGVIAAMRLFFRRRKDLTRSDRMMLLATLLAVLGVAAHASVDFPLQIASLQLYTAVYLGMLWGTRAWAPSAGRTASL